MRVGVPELYTVLFIAVVLFGRNIKDVAADFERSLRELRHEVQQMSPKSRPDLRGIEWLGLAIGILFLEVMWVASMR
jgi:Sec-independent protein translocase protein TatA